VVHDTAPTATAIKVLTGFVLALGLGLLIGSLWVIALLPAAGIIGLVAGGCYLRAPVGYDTSYCRLTVVFRAGSKQFGRIMKCDRVAGSGSFTLRLWGNGGLFAGTGIFWNQQWGIFRAYVTTSSPSNLVLVHTQGHKVLISPMDPDAVIRDVVHDTPKPHAPSP
jgi:hypothetical protein